MLEGFSLFFYFPNDQFLKFKTWIGVGTITL
jgi:hypothetical protein